MAVTQPQTGDNTVAMETNMLPPGGAGEPREPETVCGCVNSAQSDPGLVTQVMRGGGDLTPSLLLPPPLSPQSGSLRKQGASMRVKR